MFCKFAANIETCNTAEHELIGDVFSKPYVYCSRNVDGISFSSYRGKGVQFVFYKTVYLKDCMLTSNEVIYIWADNLVSVCSN